MKKFKFSILSFLLLSSLVMFSCGKGTPDEEEISVTVTDPVTQSDKIIDGSTLPSDNPWAFLTYDLSKYAGQSIKIDFSAEMKVYNNSSKAERLKWQVNESQSSYPVVAEYTFPVGESDFITVEGSNENLININGSPSLYLSTDKTEYTELKIELRNVKYTVTYTTAGLGANWLDESVPSLYGTYKDQFDYVGLACEYSSYLGIKELIDDNVCKGLSKHANTITMGNEFKPDGFFGYMWSGSGKTMVDFKASNGKTIKVPSTLDFSTVDKCLAQCKKHGLKMRGHVLVWHSQTPENFFAEGYVAKKNGNTITNLVDKETMSARQEWYIKTVLTHVADWEKQNNNGNHIIWAWDVVNEAVADDAKVQNSNWVRGSTAKSSGSSRWYQVYGSEEFIIDAFRYANAYAPADVKLCYNDYNEYMNYNGGYKTDAICTLIDEIKKGAAKTVNGKSVAPRIDAMGMQSHVNVGWPGVDGYEAALKRFLAKGVDVHVTELDIDAKENSSLTRSEAKAAYREYFKMFQKYGNSYSGSNKIECVTIWGINNKSSWIYKTTVKYPLLFENYRATPSFDAVIEAHK